MPPPHAAAAAAAVDLLNQTAVAAGVDGRVRARFSDIQALFADELVFLEKELASAARDGERPATDSAAHLVASGGKRVRPLTVLLCSACFGGISESARELAVVAEMVHTATLLHDDVIDDSPQRRGQEAARTVWGNAVSVLAGDLLLTHALERTERAFPAALGDLIRTLRTLVDGEVVQLRGRAHLDTSEAVYFRILEGKTASLFGWSARAGARAGGGSAAQAQSLGRFGERMGIAFQLVDDTLDYAGDPEQTGKQLFTDLLEGKVTLPLVLALGREPTLAVQLAEVRRGDRAAAAQLAGAVRALGVCDEVRRRASLETERALAALNEVPPSPAREMLHVLAVELTSRKS